MTKKKLKNSRPTIYDRCAICGDPYAHSHEVFYGNNSHNSKLYDMQIRLCYKHHQGDYGPHGKYGHTFDMELKRAFQKIFEERHSREKFMEIFGKNYLDEYIGQDNQSEYEQKQAAGTCQGFQTNR